MTKTPRSSFEDIYRRFAAPLTKFIAKKTNSDQEVVEEIFSRTISAAWQGFATFKNKSSYFTWICKIALNKIADYYREQIHQESIFVAPFLEDIAQIKSNELSPEEKFAVDELRASVRACIMLLPYEKRQLIYLRYWKHMTIKEIAKTFGVNERAIEGKLYRAKQLLKKEIDLKLPELEKAYQK